MMSSSTSDQILHPTNPVLLRDVNIPKEKGQTRVLPDGSLLYHEPLTNKEVPAVRLEDIRVKIVQQASKKLSYRFPKKRGYEDTNLTAFVKKDYNYGPERENRPDRLFQIRHDDAKGEKPNGYVIDEGRIVLDAFDHGLRDFGNQLPMYVSSELEGHDIEDYLRRNREISVYDLVARAPNGYYKGNPQTKNKKTEKEEKSREWHQGPPRVGTFSMRATRFRLRAGCLSWEKKDGTVAKNQRILDVIPARYKDPTVNSTKGWRDLNTAEIKKIKDGAMKKPQQGPKKKRATEAKKEAEDLQKNEEYEEEGGSQDGCFEYTPGGVEEENYVSPALNHGSAAGFSTRRPWTNIKPDNELDFHGGLSLPEPPKRSREQKSTKMGNLEEDFEARPFKKGRTPMHAHNSQVVRDGTNLLPHTRSKSQKPRHRRTGGPKLEDAVEESMRFSSATNPYDPQDQGIHTWPSSAGFNHTLAPLPESLGQPWDTLGRNAEARRSPKELRSDEWRQSDTRDPQTYFHQDNLDSDYFHEPPPGPHEGFTLGSQFIGFHAGFANVSSQVRGFDMNDSTSLPAVTQYKSSQYDLPQDDYSQGDCPQGGFPQDGFPQDGYPWDVYPQNNLPHERFPQNSFSRDSLPQTIPPQDTGPFEGLTRESLRQEHPWNGSLYGNPSCKDALPPMPPPAIVAGKRKRTDDPSHGQPKQERTIKRARSSKTALLPSPEVSLAGSEDSGYGHPQIELVESQDARLPQTESEFSNFFPGPLPSSFGYRRNGGRPPIEMHGSPSDTNTDYGIPDGPATGPLHGEPYLQAHDPIHIGTELQPGFDHDAYLPADFHRGQWEAIQASLSTDWHRDWRAQKSRYNA